METATTGTTTEIRQLRQRDLPRGFFQMLGRCFDEEADCEARKVSVEGGNELSEYGGEEGVYIRFGIDAWVEKDCDWETGDKWSTISDLDGYLSLHTIDEDGEISEEPFAEKIYKARQELNAYMDEIEATRRRQACLLIATQAICDLACTLAGQFADECKRTSGWDEAAKPYKQMVDNAAAETRRHIKGIADSGLLWEDVVEMIDAPKSDMVSMGFAEVSQWLTDKVTAIISDEMPAKIDPRIYDKF